MSESLNRGATLLLIGGAALFFEVQYLNELEVWLVHVAYQCT